MKQVKTVSFPKWANAMLTCIFLYFPLCAFSGKAVGSMGDNKLSFELKPDKKEYRLGEKIYVDLILKNIGNSPMCINSRMVINHISAPSQYREIELFMEKKGGNRLDFDCKVNTRRATAKDYKVIQPGESIVRKYDITNCFQINKKGEYSIKASFQDGTKAIDRLSGVPIFLEKIESKWVSFALE